MGEEVRAGWQEDGGIPEGRVPWIGGIHRRSGRRRGGTFVGAVSTAEVRFLFVKVPAYIMHPKERFVKFGWRVYLFQY